VGGHFRQDGFSSLRSIVEINNSLQGICSQESLAWCARMADFFGWSRSPHESLPSAGAALEAGSASGPPGAPVVDVPTQPPFLLGTALDLHGDAEALKVSVPMQTPGPAPALTPSPVEGKEKITAMPVAGRRSSGAVGVSASATSGGCGAEWCSFYGWGGGGARSSSCREHAQLCRQEDFARWGRLN